MICSMCGKHILKGQKYNFLLGTYSHQSCDDSYFSKQEKKVKYIKNWNMID
jgi:hypothetical protein